MPIISLKKLLKSDTGGALDMIVQTARSMDEMTTWLQKELQPDLAANLLAANLRADGELVLVASSSAWAAKIRFEEEKLIEIVRQGGAVVEKCRVTVSKRGQA